MEALNKIDTYIKQLGPPVLTIIAFFGNSISLYILTRPKFIKVAMFRYFIFIIIFASLSLVLIWLQFIPLLLNWNPPVEYCKIFIYFVYIGYNFYPWIHVLNSFDRLLFIKFLNRFKRFRTKKFQFIALIVIFTVFCLTNVSYILFETSSNQTVCTLIDRSLGFYISLGNLLISDLIPFCLIVLSTSINFQHMMMNKNLTTILAKRKYRREKWFLKSVLSMDVWFLLGYLPYSLLTFLTYANVFDEENQFWPFSHDLSILIVILETSCNFFVLLICNRLFRIYFKNMIIGCWKSI